MTRKIGLAAALTAMLAPFAVQASVKTAQPKDLKEQVRHELAMLPYYSIFDNLSYTVNGNQVVLTGQVTRPVLKSDAANSVRAVPGVESVINNIEVLPLSGFDDRIRLAEARAIYSDASLSRYDWGANPSIHIIVKNGVVTLEGVVNNETDRNIAGIRANGVSGVFEVRNNLTVQRA